MNCKHNNISLTYIFEILSSSWSKCVQMMPLHPAEEFYKLSLKQNVRKGREMQQGGFCCHGNGRTNFPLKFLHVRTTFALGDKLDIDKNSVCYNFKPRNLCVKRGATLDHILGLGPGTTYRVRNSRHMGSRVPSLLSHEVRDRP